MTAAYDTVWVDRLLFKFADIVNCKKITSLIRNMLSNRLFQVNLQDSCSRWRRINNGLIQGSVLSPILFNLYTNDQLNMKSKRFMFADDWVLVFQCKTFEEAQSVLEEDLKIVNDYFKSARLIMNPSKTEVCAFHLNNKEADKKLKVVFNGIELFHNFKPKYLGVVLDRSLTFKNHLEQLSQKLRTRVNLIQMLAGSEWGASPNTLRTSTLSLVCSTMNYSSPIWFNSAHTNKIDVQLNSALRIVSGTLKATPLSWLYVLCNIPPPELTRKKVYKNIIESSIINGNSLLYKILEEPVVQRLKSRKTWDTTYQSLRNFVLENE